MIMTGMLKRLLPFGTALVVAAAIVSVMGAAPAVAESRTVKVGIYENAPKVFTDPSGKPSGIFVDIIQYIAKMEGWSLTYVRGTWAEGLERLEKGEIDLMPDVAYMTSRERIFSFHKVPVLSGWSQVYARKGSGIQSILDLNGKRVVALEQTIQLETFRRLANGFELKINLVPVPDYDTGFRMIADGKADAVVTNRFYGLMNARKYGLEDTPVMFDPAQFFFAGPLQGSRPLLDAIDLHLAALKKDPRSGYYETLRRWTSEDVQFKLPGWLQILGLVLGLALIGTAIGSIVLKHQVNVRTRELELVNREMEQRIAERTLELTAANSKLQELDRLKSMFIASMSHELRTPLNSIIGFTGILLQGMSGELAPVQKEQLSRVYRAAKHLLNLITDVIDISKIEAGKMSAYVETFSLTEVIGEAVEDIQHLYSDKKLALILDVPDGILLHSDRKRVLQCLLNFLSNSFKYTEAGEVRLTARETAGMLEISVSDTGVGISSEDVGRVFAPFVRLDSHLKTLVPGTGLGLYLTRKLVEEVLDGTARVESRLGAGSTFSFRIPKELTAASVDAANQLPVVEK